MSLDDIWAEPIVETTGTSNVQAIASRTSRPALFLSDSEGEDAGNNRPRHVSPQPASLARKSNAPQGPEKSQLDVMFSGLDDDDDDLFGDVAPAVDIESLKRQADAKVAAARGALPSTSSVSLGGGTNAARDRDKEDKSRKTNRVVPKLDEDRLLGRDGFPGLLKEYKTFKVTGKGHENADLEKLFRIYHAWTHKMYPKFQFRDAVEKVEKLCRSRRMAVNLKVWRDEAHGVTPEVRHGVLQDNDDGSDSEKDSDNEPNDRPAPNPPSPSSSRPSTPVTRPGSAASTAPSVPPSVTDVDDDMDIDALLREEEEIMRAMDATGKEGRTYKPPSVEVDDEDALRAAAEGIPNGVPKMTTQPGLTSSSLFGEADNEDMWDMFDEMENQRPPPPEAIVDKEIAATTVAGESVTPAPSTPAVSDQPTIGADWDDMYE